MQLNVMAASATLILACSTATSLPAQAASPSTSAASSKFDARDLRGVWTRVPGRPFTSFPYTPEYAAILKQRQADAAAGKPFTFSQGRCLPEGMVGTMTEGPFPLEIFYQKDGKEILFIKETVGALFRVYLDRPHKRPEDLYPMFYGDSVGHWEGDVLVIDTISLGATDALDSAIGSPHSDALHVVQRLRRVSYDTLENELTLTDPKAFTQAVTGKDVYKLRTDVELGEFECELER